MAGQSDPRGSHPLTHAHTNGYTNTHTHMDTPKTQQYIITSIGHSLFSFYLFINESTPYVSVCLIFITRCLGILIHLSIYHTIPYRRRRKSLKKFWRHKNEKWGEEEWERKSLKKRWIIPQFYDVTLSDFLCLQYLESVTKKSFHQSKQAVFIFIFLTIIIFINE